MVISTYVHNNTYVYCICICLAIIKDGWPLWKDRSNPNNYVYYLRMICCASKRVRIRCCDSIYTVYLSLCTLSADPNPFRGTHCIKGCLLWSTQYHHLWIGGIDTQSISLPYTTEQNLWRHYMYITWFRF